MYACAPRIHPSLVRALVRLDTPSAPIAETYRRSREHAARLGIPRPSYESVRLLVHDARRERERHRANAETILRVLLYQLPPDALNRLD